MKFHALALLLVFTSFLRAHSEGEHNLRHWEIASADPDRIFLSFHGDPATSRAVTWRTAPREGAAYAEVVKAIAEPSFASGARRIEATTERVDLSEANENTQGMVTYHSAILDRLEPDTLYAYRVGDGKERWSEWIQFRTAQEGPGAFSFVYFGDAQNDVLSDWSRVIRMAHQTAPDAAFALHAGDLINKANVDQEWAGWFKAGGFLHSQWTGVPVTGNHEYAKMSAVGVANQRMLSLLWRPQFALPVVESLPASLHETVYSVTYQGTQVIVLNSNELVAAQIPYLEEQLKQAGVRWRIVSFHHPVFPPRGRGDQGARMREAWKSLFDRYGVDLVLQGHDHAYSRGQVPVLQGEVYAKGRPQTVYVTSVSGPKQYKIPEGIFENYKPFGLQMDRTAQNTQFFQVISIDGNALTYKAYTAVGELYDALTLTKDFSSGEKVLTEQVPAVEERTFENTAPYIR